MATFGGHVASLAPAKPTLARRARLRAGTSLSVAIFLVGCADIIGADFGTFDVRGSGGSDASTDAETDATTTGGAGGRSSTGMGGVSGSGAVSSGGSSQDGSSQDGSSQDGSSSGGTGGVPSSLDGSADGRTSSGGSDAGTPLECVTDLSGVGADDFVVHFTLKTTESEQTLALIGQRTGCEAASTFWEVTLSPTGGVVAATGDGVADHLVVVEAGNSINDGQPHEVDVIRRGGLLWYESDGVIRSAQTPDAYELGSLPPLVIGSSACSWALPAAGHAVISDVCIAKR